VVVVQRFGGALNLNIHLHALVLDGVFTNDGGDVRFHPVRRLTRARIRRRLVTTRLASGGVSTRDAASHSRWRFSLPFDAPL
jgi:hypothetical protein